MINPTFNKTLICVLCAFFITDALASPGRSDPVDVFVASSIIGLVMLVLCWIVSKIFVSLLKLSDVKAWQYAKKQQTVTKQPKKTKTSLKAKLTWGICYEIVTILILADYNGMCDFVFSYDFCTYDGFQYVVMCIFVPALIFVIALWKQEIISFFRKLWYVLSH